MLRKFIRICWIAAAWALAWGVTGAVIGALVTVFRPDTGEIPARMMPVFIGVPSAAFGLAAGLLYGMVAIALGIEATVGAKGRTMVGAGIGCAVGAVFMIVLAHSIVTLVVAILLGLLLVTALSFKKDSPRE